MKASELITKQQRQNQWGEYIKLKRSGFLKNSVTFKDYLTKTHKLKASINGGFFLP